MLLVLLVVLVGALAYAWVHAGALLRACQDSTHSDATPARRQQAYEDSVRLRASSWTRPAILLDGDVDGACRRADEAHARRRDGRCPLHGQLERPCRCGDQDWPEDLACSGEPRCRSSDGKEQLSCREPEPPPELIDVDEAAQELDERAKELHLELPPIRRPRD